MTTHVISSIVTPNVPDMSGSAPLTMLESSTAMIVPVSTVPVTTHLWAVAWAGSFVMVGSLSADFHSSVE